MTDWYFAGMFDRTFWAIVGTEKLSGETAAAVLRPLCVATGETDLSWLPIAAELDRLCAREKNFEITRRSGRIQWKLGPWHDRPAARGSVDSIRAAIEALGHAA